MEIIQDSHLIEKYYNNFPLTDFFEFDIYPFTTIVRFKNGESIFQEGNTPAFLYYLIEGRAKLYLTQGNGRISLINFLNAPCFIGEMELLEAQSYSNGVTAVTTCTCYAIRIRDCKSALLNDVKFLRYLCGFLSKKAIGNTYNYSKNQSYPLENRLADFILITAHNNLYTEQHTEAADFLGVTYRHLLYVLADFVNKGYLSKTKHGYEITDIDSLRYLIPK